MPLEIGSQFGRHKAQLYKWPDTIGQQAIINLIDIGPVVDRLPLLILVVGCGFAVKDGMKADVADIGDLFHLPQVVAVTLAKRNHRSAGAKHLLPEMGKGMRRRCRIDGKGADGRLGGKRSAEREP